MKNWQMVNLPKGISDEVTNIENNFYNWLKYSKINVKEFLNHINSNNFQISHYIDDKGILYVKLPLGECLVADTKEVSSLYDMVLLLFYIGNKLDIDDETLLNIKKPHYYSDVVKQYVLSNNIYAGLLKKQ